MNLPNETEIELRKIALERACQTSYMGGMIPGPSPNDVVGRAKSYLAFLTDEAKGDD